MSRQIKVFDFIFIYQFLRIFRGNLRNNIMGQCRFCGNPWVIEFLVYSCYFLILKAIDEMLISFWVKTICICIIICWLASDWCVQLEHKLYRMTSWLSVSWSSPIYHIFNREERTEKFSSYSLIGLWVQCINESLFFQLQLMCKKCVQSCTF